MTIQGTATHTKIAEAVVLRIQALDLNGISDANIELRLFNEDLAKCLPGPPGVMVLPVGVEGALARQGSTATDVISYPVLVLHGDTCGGGDIEAVTEIDKHLKWREDIRVGLWHRTEELVAVGAPASVCDIHWVPDRNFIPRMWTVRNMWVGAMRFNVDSYETRT